LPSLHLSVWKHRCIYPLVAPAKARTRLLAVLVLGGEAAEGLGHLLVGVGLVGSATRAVEVIGGERPARDGDDEHVDDVAAVVVVLGLSAEEAI
jgi:hypothetical protein